MATTEKVGVEGKTYQNKRTKRICVLESQDTVHKTVLLRDADGKSVSQTFPTFRRDWVAYAGKSDIKTSSQKTEETTKKEVEKKAETKKEETKGKKKSSAADRMAYLTEIKNIVQTELDKKKFDNVDIVTKKGSCVTIRNNKHCVVELWIKPSADSVVMAITDEVYNAMTINEKIKGELVFKHHEVKRPLPQDITVTKKNLNALLKDLFSVLGNFINKPKPVKEKKVSKEPKEKVAKEVKKTPKVTKPAPKKATAKKEVK